LRVAHPYWATFIIAFPLLAVPFSAHQDGVARAHETKHASKLYDFKIIKPNLLVDGANLSKVEVWFWSTGTEITKPAPIGTATRITGPGKHEKWVLRIPPGLLAVEIFATAFDEAGNVIGKKSLPYRGASALYEALYEKQ
jgi:hypothetical protein